MTHRHHASALAAAASLVLGATCLADGKTVTDTFESGVNIGAWTISGGGTIEPIGGTPGAWLHRMVDTFAPIVSTTDGVASPFVGDYRALGVTGIGLDAQLLFRDWGEPVGFEMSLLLRDTKGTAAVDDDDYAYYVGPNVPLMSEGWVHFDFDVPSESTDAVPPGWSGGWVGDLEAFRPGVDWNDVITSVDRVEVWWLHPAFFAILANWDVGVDNISIRTAGASCPGDGDGDGVIGIADLLGLLAAWGTSDATYDIAPAGGDGIVDIQDLLALLAAWGPC